MRTDIEAKFRAETPEPLEVLATLPLLGRARLGPAHEVDEVDRYLDTDDARLATARWAARLRSRDGAIRIAMKGPPGSPAHGGWQHRRPEIEGPASEALTPDAWPPSAARDLLAELAGGQPLRERIRLAQRRTERSVSLGDGTAIGTLTLDRVRVMAGEVDLGRLHVVELELAAEGDGEAELENLAAELASIPGLEPDPITKFEHALARQNAAR